MAKERTVKIKQNLSEKYFSKLFENLSDFVLVVSAEGKINYATPSVQKILGEKAENLLGEFAFRFVHPDDLARIKAEYQELITKPDLLQETNFRVVSSDGSVRYIRGFRQNLLGDPEIQGIILTVHDTTEHFLLNQKLLQQQNLLNEVEEISNVGGWEWDIKTEKLYWTKETYRIHDFELEEFEEGSTTAIKKSIECYSVEDQNRISDAFNDCASKGKPYDLECRFTSAAGQQKWVRTIGKPIFENNKVSKVIGNIVDISKSKREELLYNARLNLVKYSYISTHDEFLQKFLDEAEKLTGSKIGFFHFVNDDQETLTLQVWSTNTLESMCTAVGKGFHYNISEAGVWVDCFPKREPVIHNNYESLPHKKGMPEGHAKVARELVVPLIRNEKVVAILGLGNKENDYTEQDVDNITKLADWAWDITERKIAEEKLKESEDRVRTKLQSLLDPEDTAGNLELEDIINSDAIQSLMNKFYNLTGLPVSVIDLKGKILVGTGWQNICTKFHRANTKTLNNCIECDTVLSIGVKPGTYKDYLCKNNLWDAVTPIYIGGKHVGNLFTGQFFYADAIPAKEVFIKQADEFGFNLKDYLVALDEVPIFSRDKIQAAMAFYIEFAEMISQLSYSNIKLARTLFERDKLIKTIEESRQKEEARNKELEESRVATLNIIDDLSAEINERIKTEDQLRKSEERFQFAARATDDIIYDWDVAAKKAVFSHNYKKFFGYSVVEETSKDYTAKIHPIDREVTLNYTDSIIYGGGESYNCEYRYKRSNGDYSYLLDRGYVVRDSDGTPIRLIGTLMDLTKQKEAEQELKDSREKFSQLVLQMDQGIAVHEAIFDLNGNMVDYKFIEMNDSYERITGLKKSNLIGKTVLEALPGTETYWIEKFGAVVKTGEPLHYENYSRELGKFFGLVAYRNRKNQFAVIISDITERKQTELALRESEARLKSIFISAPIGVGLLIDRVFLQVNDKFCEITGYKPDEVIGKNARILYPSDEEFEFVGREKYAQISRKGTGAVETLWKKKDGTVINILLSSTPIDNNDLSKGITFTSQDITKRKNTENALKESEIKYRTVADYNYDWEYWLDNNNKYIYNSPSCERITGYSIEELGQDLQTTIDIIHPDDKENMLKHYNDEFSHRAELESAEFRIFTKQGKTKWISHICRKVYDNENNVIGIRGSNRDITDEKHIKIELEKRSHAIEQSPVSIVITDLDGKIEYVNPMFSKITGYTFEEVKGENPRILKSGEQSNEYYKNMWLTITSGEIWSGVLHNKRKDGELFWESAIISPIKNEKEKISHFIAIKEDITEDVKREEELKNYRENLEQLVKQRTSQLDSVNNELKLQLDRSKILEKQLQESLSKEMEINELKTRFISTVSHEFRTPLSALFSSSQMIQRYSKNWSEEKLEQHYKRIESTVKYLTKLLDDVLTISRADREILKNEPEPVNIKELLHSFADEIKSQIDAEPTVNIITDLQEDEIKVDKKLLKHMVINLLTNGVKYSPEGSEVNLKVTSKNEKLFLTVSDSGSGIPEDEIKYIFDAFYRAKNSIGIQGSGLGLNIVKRAVETINGTISVNSEVNRGTTFTIIIPIDK